MNNDPTLMLVLFLLVCAVLLLLPFYPAWSEWLRPTDRQPLRLGVGDDSQASLARLLRQQLTLLLANGPSPAYGSLEQALAEAGLPESVKNSTQTTTTDNQTPPPLTLAQDVCFQQIDAPEIVFGHPHPDSPSSTDFHQTDLSPHAPLEGAQPWGPHGWRVDGDCIIQGGQHFTGSLVVTGLLSIGKGARVDGDVKAHQGVVIGEHAQMLGSVISSGGVRVFDSAFIGGPLVAETLLQLGSDVQLGSSHAPTSVSASVMLVGDGTRIHGSVRATQIGLGWAAA